MLFFTNTQTTPKAKAIHCQQLTPLNSHKALAAAWLELQGAVCIILLLCKQPVSDNSSTFCQPCHPQLPEHNNQLAAVHVNSRTDTPQPQLPQAGSLPCGTEAVAVRRQSVIVEAEGVRKVVLAPSRAPQA